ncbi:hypothetical protein PI125_g5177 [Phytophthora idaei]|nr:hypothetical protein PI125_g5177 [Phytophthora idaei]
MKTVQVLLEVWGDRSSNDSVTKNYVTCALKEAVTMDNVEVVRLARRSGYYAVCPAVRFTVVNDDLTMAEVLVERSTPSAIVHSAAEAAMGSQARVASGRLRNTHD